MTIHEAAKAISHEGYTVGWICSLPEEQTAATAMLDHIHTDLPKPTDDSNTYTLGSIGKHNIVIACLPKGNINNNAAAAFAIQMVRTFPSIKVGLRVGIASGIPPKVRLGDVVVSTPVDQYPGVVQWDFGKTEKGGIFRRTGALNNPPSALLTALTKLETNHEMRGSKIPQYLDDLKKKWPRLVPKYTGTESLKDPLQSQPGEMRVHYGLIASGNQVIKDSDFRDRLNESLGGHVLCVEMEAAGLLDFPCVVIRGICDYADSQRNQDWREYAATVAAAFGKEFLQYVQTGDVNREPPVRDILNQVYDAISTIQANTSHTRARLDTQEDTQILDWLTPVDYGPHQSDYLSRRQPETGNWLLESEKFLGWLATSHQTLFCPGIPGAGKTILTSVVINHLNSKFGNDPGVGIAYIYCSFRRQHEQKIGDLLASVLKQLTQCQSSLPEEVKKLYQKHEKGRTRPSISEILATLQSVVAIFSRVLIIVDALDECQTSDQCRMKFLEEILHLQTRHGVNIFATSRSIPEIVAYFKESLSIEISASPSDVKRYLEGHIGQLPSFIQQDQQLQKEITTGISKAAGGMFLLAQLYLHLLADRLTLNDMRSAMNTYQKQGEALSKDQDDQVLAHAYEQTMERIIGQMPGMRTLATNVLSWVTYSRRQLTTTELQHALGTKSGKSKLDHGDLPYIEDMVSVCSGLVTIDEESGIIRLVHYTTKEYLKRTLKRWIQDPESVIATTCVTYLSFTVFEAGFCKTNREFEARLGLNPLYDYAANNWGYHAKDKEPSPVISFLQSTAKVEASSQALMASKDNIRGIRNGQLSPTGMTGLHLAAFFGVSKATETLLALAHDPDRRDTYGQTPLWYACQNGHAVVTRLLVKASPNTTAVTKSKMPTMLDLAATKGHLEVDKVLLAEGDSPYATDQLGTTALHVAAKGGHLDVIKVLLAEGANPNATDQLGMIALHVAAEDGHLEVVKVLLAEGANPNATCPLGLTALPLAAEGGYLEVVNVLLAEGANINAATSSGRTALHVAAEDGHLEVVNVLLAGGANVNAANSSGRTTLHVAAEYGHPEVVNVLLAEGANVNAATSSGRTALHIAAGEGYLEVVNVLLAKGANFNATNIYGSTVLHEAAAEGYLKVVAKLLAAGADINTADKYGRLPLQVASQNGHLEVVKNLPVAGADLTTTNEGRWILSPLAAKRGQLKVGKKLPAAESDSNTADSDR